MKLGISLKKTGLYAPRTGARRLWMWLSDKIDLRGVVDNSKMFNSWMFAYFTIDLGGLVENTKSFDDWMFVDGTIDAGGVVINARSF